MIKVFDSARRVEGFSFGGTLRQGEAELIIFWVGETTQAFWEEITRFYGFFTDADAPHRQITSAENLERLTAEVEERVLSKPVPILESRRAGLFRTEWLEGLVPHIVLAELIPEAG